MRKKPFVFFILWLLAAICGSQNDTNPLITPHHNPGLRFTENTGQWQNNILFRAQLNGGMLYLEKNGLTFNFYDKEKFRHLHHGGVLSRKYKNLDMHCHAYKITFENCNTTYTIEKQQPGNDYENFFLGNDKTKWKSEVKNYHQVWLKNLYNNIDYEVFTAANGIKYNLHVKPGANPAQVKMRYNGADELKIHNGSLFVKLTVNGVTEQKPYAFQIINGKVITVRCNYKLTKNILSFDFPDGYNKDYELVIDPVLVFAAQSGSQADNFGMTATFDTQGNLYAGGTVYGNGYPTTLGAYDVTFNSLQGSGLTDVVITKYNAAGTGLLYSTYIGGSETEVVSSLIVDYNNNLCFYGATGSTNFPTLNNAYDTTFNGGVGLSFVFNGTGYPNGTDIYIAKFNSAGTALLGSTYLGGSDNDGVNHVNHLTLVNIGQNTYINEYVPDSLQYNYGDQYRGEIQVDILNNIYITSSTRSSNFPTVNAFDNTLGGKQDAIVAKFNPSLSQLVYSSYLGGSLNESGNSLIVNSVYQVYVTGGTCSSDFPATAGAYSQSYNGGIADGYLARINAQGNQIMRATYFGTNKYDQSYFVQSDKYNRIYIYGQSLGNMPVVSGATNAVLPYNNPGTHQFITRFDTILSNINMSTVFGSKSNSVDISPSAFAVDKCENIYISGWGGSILDNNDILGNMPLASPTQASTSGFDFYFMGLTPNGAALQYGSYFGGNTSSEHVDGGTSRFDPRGKIYQSVCAGCGGNQDFPVTPGAWPNISGNPNQSSNCNNGVIKLDFQLQMSVSTINTNTLAGCMPLTVTFTNATPGLNPGATFKWYFDNATNTTNINPSFTFTTPGTYTVALVVNDNLTCNKKDSSVTYVTVFPNPATSITAAYSQCTNTVALTHTTTGNLGANPYAWNFGNGGDVNNQNSPIFTYTTNGTFNITFTVTDQNGCKATRNTTVNIFDFRPGVTGSDTICYGSIGILNATGGTNYTWTPAVSLSSSVAPSPQASPTVNTIYTVTIENNSAGFTCSRTLTTQVQVDPTPTTSFSYSHNPCGGGVHFTDHSESDIIKWKWNLAPTRTSTLQSPYHFYFNGGTFTVSLEAVNMYGCKDITDTVITVLTPEPVSVSDPTTICIYDKVQLSAQGGVSYQWTPTLTLDFPASQNPIASPLTTTEYSVLIQTNKMVDGKNCGYLLTTYVGVEVLSYAPVKATANPVLIVSGNSSTLTYHGDYGALITWLPENSTSPTVGYVVTAKPLRPTTYTVIATKGPCTETVTVHVDAFTEGCLAADVFIPNTFTPNGDASNNLLYVRSVKVNEIYFAVYNRWGEMVFETHDKGIGWDGRYKGREMDVGVYGWYLKAKCVSGEEAFIKGNVTLVR